MEVVKCPPCCLALDHFDLINIFISIGTPDRGRIFYQWAHQCLVSQFTDGWGFRPYVAFCKSKGPVCLCAYVLDVVVERVLGHFGHGHFGHGRFGQDISAMYISATDISDTGHFGQRK